MTFDIFLAPFHRLGENPTLALDRDMERIEWLDHLGDDEVWIGEHHSAGWELIASPEIFIAAAAQRTRHIRGRRGGDAPGEAGRAWHPSAGGRGGRPDSL